MKGLILFGGALLGLVALYAMQYGLVFAVVWLRRHRIPDLVAATVFILGWLAIVKLLTSRR